MNLLKLMRCLTQFRASQNWSLNDHEAFNTELCREILKVFEFCYLSVLQVVHLHPYFIKVSFCLRLLIAYVL